MFDLAFIPNAQQYGWWKKVNCDLAPQYTKELYRGGMSLYVTERDEKGKVIAYASLGTYDNLRYAYEGCSIVLKQNPDELSAKYCKEASALLKVAIKWVDEKLADGKTVVLDAGIIVDKAHRGKGLGGKLTKKLIRAAKSLKYNYLLFRCDCHVSSELIKKYATVLAQGKTQSIQYVKL